MFYTFNQNNSGGSFVFDEDRGLSTHVIVEADSADAANDIAESIGIYFNGCDLGIDCTCCGNRWGAVYETQGESEPSIYALTIREWMSAQPSFKWQGEGKPEIYVHYADGTLQGFHMNSTTQRAVAE
jgi:hypothetical protein